MLKHHHIRRYFFKKLLRNLVIGMGVILLSLWGGMEGYHYYEEMSWLDAYVNASMILSGMGPLGGLKTEGGKIFAGTYALFSGIIFLVVIAFILGPIFHYLFVKFDIKEMKK